MCFKLSEVRTRERPDLSLKRSQETNIRPTIIGKANEVKVLANNVEVTALLDTGSMVSTMSTSLCSTLGLPIQQLDKVFSVRGAGGHNVPYRGVVEVKLSSTKVGLSDLVTVMLVVPDTEYHRRVPVLIGTNVLNTVKDIVNTSDQVWRNTLTMLAKHQALSESPDSLGSLTITKPLTVPARGRVMVYGQTRVKAICQQLNICLDGAKGLPRGVLATPCVNTITPGHSRSKLPVELVNHLSQDVTIPAKARICDLYSLEDIELLDHATAEMPLTGKSPEDMHFLNNFQHLKHQLDDQQIEDMHQLLLKWKTVFSQHDLDLGLMPQPPSRD